MEKNLACQDLRDEPWKGWGYSSAIQNWPYMYSALGLLSSITPIPLKKFNLKIQNAEQYTGILQSKLLGPEVFLILVS